MNMWNRGLRRWDRQIPTSRALGVACCLLLISAVGCSGDPRISVKNLDAITDRVERDEDIRLADVEKMLGPGRPLDPQTARISLPADQTSDATLSWKIWGEPGGDYIVINHNEQGRVNYVTGKTSR
jgi:hypothetical protein